MNTKHTPGPWTFKPSKRIRDIRGITTHLGAEVTDAADEHLICSPPSGVSINWEANARLIAAAPELLEVLGEMVTMIDSEDEPGRGSPWHIKASAIVAKAKGC